MYTKLSASLIRRDSPLADRWEEKEEEVKPKGIRSGNSGPSGASGKGGNIVELGRDGEKGELSEESKEARESKEGDGRRSCMQIPSVHLRGILAGSVED